MEGIYFKDSVYVLIETEEENESYIYHPKFKDKVTLYGGRVNLMSPSINNINAWLEVDGINIINFEHDDWNPRIPISSINSHLNAMEIYGVDGFIQNYKKTVDFLRIELLEQQQRFVSILSSCKQPEESKYFDSRLRIITARINKILGMLFNIMTIMSAGLSNEKVNNIYQSVLDSLS